MSDGNSTGKIGWIDITVDDAESLRDFYAEVTGWVPQDVSMGDYSDFNMTIPGSGEPAAGICHARGSNAELPPQWMIYITVENADASAATCTKLGGKVLVGPKAMGDARYCVVQDPSGAVAALYQPG
jgi:predicted enzyme related to lactoylglutathione lyase